jgi:hypothetical protein
MSLYKGTNKNIRRYIIMELCLNQGFAPLSQDEMIAVDGGGVYGAVVGGVIGGVAGGIIAGPIGFIGGAMFGATIGYVVG